jgi:DNA-directed RNA polymerase specialized sigma24 family protein
MPWSEIVQEIQSGDERGVELLYLAVSDCARAQLYQSIDPQAVDDHLQEIVMIVLAAVKSGELRDAQCLMGFVRTVTRRQVAVHIRRAIFSRRRLVPVETAAPPMAPMNESPEARFSAMERVTVVRNVLGRLRARDREILVRFYYDEQDAGTICREMALTATQFRLYKSRALAKCYELRQRPLPLSHSTRPLRIA